MINRLADTKTATLAERMELPPADFLNLLVRLTRAMDVIHQAGYLCLNLSPETVLIRENGAVVPKNLDSLIPVSAFLSGAALSIPVNACCPPEVLRYTDSYPERKRFSKNGPRSDVFSVGAILYYYLFGPRIDPQQMYAAILSGEFPLRRQDIPEKAQQQLSLLLKETLAYFPGERLENMDLLSRQLRDILQTLAEN